MVAHTGLEPVVSALRGQRVSRLHQCALAGWNYRLLAEYRQICSPWADLFAILLAHHPRDLRDVAQIVNDPRRQQLAERYDPKFRMLPAFRQ